jgi:hypothetical protein
MWRSWATVPPAAATPLPGTDLPTGIRRRHSRSRRTIDVDRGLTPASAHHDDVGWLRRRIERSPADSHGNSQRIAELIARR